ncbi:hypothetical protein [Silvanigrella aquatica]|nr:hypothetical protein [Silvanigrella aquatica]
MENFSLHTTEQKKVILSFLKVFITELIYLNSTIQLNKNIYSYTDFLNCESTKEISLKCKRDVVLLFGKFFKEKIQITENIPKKIKNYNSFSLGKNYIYSSYTDKKSFLIGSMFYSFLNRVSVKIEIHDYEIERLKFFLNVIFYKNRTLLFSSQNKVKNISYIFNFIIEKNKLISVTSIPNLKNYRNYFAIS